MDCSPSYGGRGLKRPHEFDLTVAIPHLNTIDELEMCVRLLRLQTIRPYIMIVDTGSDPETAARLELMRGHDLEIHYIAAGGYRHASEPVTVALDLSQSLCQTKLLFHTHADCFLRRRDCLENFARLTNSNTPVVGYRMSPRDWATKDWEWMIGHTATMFYMPSIHRAGATWSMQRMHYQLGLSFENLGGWPDTETCFNHCLRDAGIKPVFIGHDRNKERQVDDNIDHFRSFCGSKVHDPAGEYHRQAMEWRNAAMTEAAARLELWRQQIIDLAQT